MATPVTIVVNAHREQFDVLIGRGSPFGNPYGHLDRNGAISAYEKYFNARCDNEPEFRKQVNALRGKILGCWCKPRMCHGDVIILWLQTHES